MKILDYLFYRIYNFLKLINRPFKISWVEDWNTIAIIGTLVLFNLLTIGFVIDIIWMIPPLPLFFEDNFIIIGVILNYAPWYFVFIFNNRYKGFASKWRDEESDARKMKGWIIVSYIVITLALFFSTLLLSSGKKQNIKVDELEEKGLPINYERSLLLGKWNYQDLEGSYTVRTDSTVEDKFSDIELLIRYNIIWKDDSNTDHELVIKEVIPSSNTPSDIIEKYQKGDIVYVRNISVTAKELNYTGMYKNESFIIQSFK